MVYFHDKNPNSGIPILKGLGMVNVGIFYVHLECCTAILVYVVTILKFFLHFGMFYQTKSGNPDL
jgi:hypothetical protein